jgi:LPS sulfotransferase NodH
MSHDHRARVDEQLREVIPGYRRLDDVLPAHRWVWLKRRDKILQAISWCRAEQSNEWAMAQAGTSKSSTNLNYDFFHILSRVMLILAAEFAWELYFERENIQPFVIVYEDFFADVPKHLRALITYLGGLDPARSSIDCGLTYQVQRTDNSYALRDRFAADCCRIGENSLVTELGVPLQKWMSFFLDFGWRGQQ